MGTSQYLAPERIAGGPGTPASVLYSLGIVLHECLTGMPPYDGSAAEVMASHLYLPLPPLPANAPPELDALVARLTAKDPGRRFRDARELAALASRLRDSIGTGPALVPSPAEPDPAGLNVDALARRRQRRAAAILGGGAIVLASGGLTGLIVSGAVGAPAAKSPPASPAGSSTHRSRPAAPGSTSASAPGGAIAPSATTSGTRSGHAKHGKVGKTATPSPRASATASPSGSPTPAPSSSGTQTASPSGSPSSSGTPSTSPSAVPSASPSHCVLGICL